MPDRYGDCDAPDPGDDVLWDAEQRRAIEEWRAIAGYEGCYEVSSNGRVRSLERWINDAAQRNLESAREQLHRAQKDFNAASAALGVATPFGHCGCGSTSCGALNTAHQCGCARCNPDGFWMFTCSRCGDKCCPQAMDHRAVCANHSDADSRGSDSPSAPQNPVRGVWVAEGSGTDRRTP